MGRTDECRNEAGPTGLVRCAHPAAVIAMEIFVKKHQVTKVRVVAQLGIAVVDGPTAVLVDMEYFEQAARQFVGHL